MNVTPDTSRGHYISCLRFIEVITLKVFTVEIMMWLTVAKNVCHR